MKKLWLLLLLVSAVHASAGPVLHTVTVQLTPATLKATISLLPIGGETVGFCDKEKTATMTCQLPAGNYKLRIATPEIEPGLLRFPVEKIRIDKDVVLSRTLKERPLTDVETIQPSGLTSFRSIVKAAGGEIMTCPPAALIFDRLCATSSLDLPSVQALVEADPNYQGAYWIPATNGFVLPFFTEPGKEQYLFAIFKTTEGKTGIVFFRNE